MCCTPWGCVARPENVLHAQPTNALLCLQDMLFDLSSNTVQDAQGEMSSTEGSPRGSLEGGEAGGGCTMHARIFAILVGLCFCVRGSASIKLRVLRYWGVSPFGDTGHFC